MTVIADHDIRLNGFTIPKGQRGHISRVSPRLKKSHTYKNQSDATLCVKFPRHPSFFCLKSEVKLAKRVGWTPFRRLVMHTWHQQGKTARSGDIAEAMHANETRVSDAMRWLEERHLSPK